MRVVIPGRQWRADGRRIAREGVPAAGEAQPSIADAVRVRHQRIARAGTHIAGSCGRGPQHRIAAPREVRDRAAQIWRDAQPRIAGGEPRAAGIALSRGPASGGRSEARGRALETAGGRVHRGGLGTGRERIGERDSTPALRANHLCDIDHLNDSTAHRDLSRSRRSAPCSFRAAARASAPRSCAPSRAGSAVAFVDIADAPSQALVASLGARVRYLRCDVRDIAALRAALAAAARRARPDHRADQQRRARRPSRDRRGDARVLGREHGGEPSPPVLRRAGRGAGHGGGGGGAIINMGSVSWMRGRPHMVALHDGEGRDRGPHAHARARVRRARTSASTRSCRARSSRSASRRCGLTPADRSSGYLDAAVPQVPRCPRTTSRARRCSSRPTRRARSPGRAWSSTRGLAQTAFVA